MWRVLAEEEIHCTECFHEIKSGTVCLSQMPETMPEHFNRRKYENFCIECAKCRSKGKLPCYVRRLNHWYTSAAAKEGIGCFHCGETIPKGTWTTTQKFYAWLDTALESNNAPSCGSGTDTGIGSTGVTVGSAANRVRSRAWNNLSEETQQLLRSRGLGSGRGTRSFLEAKQFYETTIPEAVRIQGEKSVRQFIDGKHASHIESVSNSPNLAKSPDNIVWEDAGKNLARGSKNMTRAEVAAADKVGQVAGLKATGKATAKGGIIAAVIEAPVAATENYFHWKRWRKSGAQAAKAAAMSTAGAGAVGVGATAGAAVVAQGATLVGISPTLGPAGVPLAVAGVLLLAGASAHRLIKAAKRDLPLDEYWLFFCKYSDCKSRFAWHTIEAARGRKQRHSPWLSALMVAVPAAAVIAIVAWLL